MHRTVSYTHLEHAARELRPKFIALAGSPIPFMNGTDFPAIARVIEAETGIPTFSVPTNGCLLYTSRLLLRLTEEGLEQEGFEVLRHHMIPPNDGGIAIGQAAYGLYYLQNVKKEI